MQELDERTKRAFELTGKIESTNRDIEMSRTNILTVLNADPSLNKQLKKAVTLKWWWVSVLAAFVVFYTVCIFLMIKASTPARSSFMFSIIQGVCGILIIGLSISGMIYVSKKF